MRLHETDGCWQIISDTGHAMAIIPQTAVGVEIIVATFANLSDHSEQRGQDYLAGVLQGITCAAQMTVHGRGDLEPHDPAAPVS